MRVRHVQMHAAAHLPCVFGRAGRKIQGRCDHARQLHGVKPRGQRFRVDIRRTQDGKGISRAATLGAVDPFQHAGARIQQRRLKARHGQAGHHPHLVQLRKQRMPVPPQARNHLQIAPQIPLVIDHQRKFPAGQPVAQGDIIAADKAARIGPQEHALRHIAQGIGTIQHDQPFAVPGAILQQNLQRGNKGIAACTHILDIIHQDVKGRTGFLAQMVGSILAVQAGYGQPAGAVHRVFKGFSRALIAAHAVLGCKQQLQAAYLPQPFDGRLQSRRAPGGRRGQRHAAVQQPCMLANAVNAVFHPSFPAFIYIFAFLLYNRSIKFTTRCFEEDLHVYHPGHHGRRAWQPIRRQ